MAADVTIDDSLEGKRVINAAGKQIGVISAVRGETIFVDPNPGITDRVRSMLGWDDVDDDDYSIPGESIDRVADDEVHLRVGL